MEVAQQRADGAAARDHVDPQRAAGGPDGGDGARLRPAGARGRAAGTRALRRSAGRHAACGRTTRTPRPRSSAAIRLETACWVSASSAAARWNWPASATATKVLTASRSTTNGCSDGCLPRAVRGGFDLAGLGRRFGWLWAAYAVSTFGTWFALDAFALIAILVLDAGPAAVSALAAAGRAVGAVVAVPLGPWVEFRRKRRVMVAMDLVRFAAVHERPRGVRARPPELRPAAGRRRSSSPRPTSRSRRPAAPT